MNSESNASPLDLTVAICTWNRAALLRQTLQSMQKLIIPEGVAWEVLVVNNNCTDNTSDVIQEFARQLPIRECLEPTPGKSHALNTGTQAARGRMIIWTDDDVLVRPDWLAAYWDAINRYPQAEFFGGPVEPWFETDPPQWLEKAWPVVRHAYASINHSDHDMPITEKSVPFGVNWAIRKATQLAPPHVCPEICAFALRKFADLLAKAAVRIPVIGSTIAMAVQSLANGFTATARGRTFSRSSGKTYPLGYFLVAEKPGVDTQPPIDETNQKAAARLVEPTP